MNTEDNPGQGSMDTLSHHLSRDMTHLHATNTSGGLEISYALYGYHTTPPPLFPLLPSLSTPTSTPTGSAYTSTQNPSLANSLDKLITASSDPPRPFPKLEGPQFGNQALPYSKQYSATTVGGSCPDGRWMEEARCNLSKAAKVYRA